MTEKEKIRPVVFGNALEGIKRISANDMEGEVDIVSLEVTELFYPCSQAYSDSSTRQARTVPTVSNGCHLSARFLICFGVGVSSGP